MAVIRNPKGQAHRRKQARSDSDPCGAICPDLPSKMVPIIPAIRRKPFDDPAWLFDLKLDGFRGIADTVERRMLSKNGNRLTRVEHACSMRCPSLACST